MPEHSVKYCASRMEWAITESEYQYWREQLEWARVREVERDD